MVAETGMVGFEKPAKFVPFVSRWTEEVPENSEECGIDMFSAQAQLAEDGSAEPEKIESTGPGTVETSFTFATPDD